MAKFLALALLFSGLFFCSAPTSRAQGTEFTYQGSLKDAGNPASGNYDFEFALFDSLSGGAQIGSTIPKNMVAISNGAFSVKLDFGSVFPGANRYLEIRVRLTGQPGITPLSPRQLVNSSPYSITAADATSPNIARLNVPHTAVTATGTATVTSGFITSAAVTNGGAGYTTPPTVTINDATGSGAILIANISGGSVTSLTVQNPGSGYSAGATLTLSSPPSNANQTFVTPNFFTGVNTMNNVNNTFAGSFTGSGTGLANVNAAQFGGLPPSRYVQSDASGNVGIGASPGTGSKLTVGGQVELTAGALKFPDATTQTTAGLSSVTTTAPLTGDGTAGSPLGLTSPLSIRDADNPAFQPFSATTSQQGALLVTVPAGKRLVVESLFAAIRTPGNNSGNEIVLVVSGTLSHYFGPSFARNDVADTLSFYNYPFCMYLSPGQNLNVFFATTTQFVRVTVTGYYVNLPGPSVTEPRK